MTSDDDLWFEHLFGGLQNTGQTVARKRSGFVTGVVISKPYLVVNTVRVGKLFASSEPRRSKTFELLDRSATAISSVAREIDSFVRRHRVEEVFVRSHDENGKFAGHPWNFKLEAALQLSAARTWFVNTNGVRIWISKRDCELPDAPEDLPPGHRFRNLWKQALETAVFASENCETRRFWDGGQRQA